MRRGSVNGNRYFSLDETEKRRGTLGKFSSNNATKWRKLEPGACIHLPYNEVQSGTGVDEIMNVKGDVMIDPHSGIII